MKEDRHRQTLAGPLWGTSSQASLSPDYLPSPYEPGPVWYQQHPCRMLFNPLTYLYFATTGLLRIFRGMISALSGDKVKAPQAPFTAVLRYHALKMGKGMCGLLA